MQIKKFTPLLVALALTACSGDTATTTEEPADISAETKVEETEQKVTTEEPENEEQPIEEVTNEAEDLEEDDDFYNPNNIGKTIKDPELGDITVVKAGRDIENSYKVGDLDFSIYGAALAKIKTNNQELKDYWKSEEVDVIMLATRISNNSDKTITLYSTQDKIVTDTREQLEPDLLLSQGAGEILGNVDDKSANIYYPESDLEDINEFTFYLSPGYNEDFGTIGEEHQIKITFDESGKLKSIE